MLTLTARMIMWNFIMGDILKVILLHMRGRSIIRSTPRIQCLPQRLKTMMIIPALISTCKNAWVITVWTWVCPQRTAVEIPVTNKRRMVMKLIQKLTVLFGLVAIAGPSFAQNRSTFAGIANAYDYAMGINGAVAPLIIDSNSTATGTVTYTVQFGYTTAADGTQFNPLSTSGPVIVGSGASIETVTPTAVSCSTPQIIDSCTFTASFSNAHGVGERISSGSAGLEEAANYRFTHQGGLVALSPSWFAQEGGLSAGLTALVTFKSFGATVTVLNYSGTAGALSYTAAGGSVYASTTHVIY
jgi:hypothetical protein